MNNILYINLKNNNIKIISIENINELDISENDLVFKAPILAGYGALGINKLTIFSGNKISNVGGYFAHYMKCNGYDFVVIKEKSKEPIYIHIDEEKISIKNAIHMYQNNCKNTDIIIKKELNNTNLEIAAIGISGVNKVDFSKIMFRGSKSCGKNGIGKLMGEKNLKAIAIQQHKNLNPFNKKELYDINKLMTSKIENSKLSSWYNESNSCYGCILNCKSSSINKIVKRKFSIDEAKAIDKICNEYGMDSIIFADIINYYKKNKKLCDINFRKFADEIVKNNLSYIEYEKRLKDKETINIHKEENEFEELGFCKFLIQKNIIDKRYKELLINCILGDKGRII